jgi:hypothetical protein
VEAPDEDQRGDVPVEGQVEVDILKAPRRLVDSQAGLSADGS